MQSFFFFKQFDLVARPLTLANSALLLCYHVLTGN